MRVVVDTNCLIVSIPPKGNYYWLYEVFRLGKFDWFISNEILTEYREKLASFYSKNTAFLVYSVLSASPHVTFSEPFFKWQLKVNDPDDNKFVDMAIATHADYLISNDKHFDILKAIEFPKVNIISLDDFKDVINSF
jgi:putative PIN family toxin of toxin-antitoxin system